MSNFCKRIVFVYNYIESVLDIIVISNVVIDFLMKGT